MRCTRQNLILGSSHIKYLCSMWRNYFIFLALKKIDIDVLIDYINAKFSLTSIDKLYCVVYVNNKLWIGIY